MRITSISSERRSILKRVLQSNEHRFEILEHRGIRVGLDGPAIVQLLSQRFLDAATSREFHLSWALDVASLLNEFEFNELEAVS